MARGTLAKFNRKKELWISPKHPLYLECNPFKIYYAASLLIHTRLNKKNSSLSNTELERLFTKGFDFTAKETIEIMRLSKDVQPIVDTIIAKLQSPIYRYLFLLDLFNVSMTQYHISLEEQKSIDLFARLLEVEDVYKNILLQFITASSSQDYEDCIQIFEEMKRLHMGLTMTDLAYYMINYPYTMQVYASSLHLGESNYFRSNCEFHHTITIPKGTTVHISHAIVKVYGNFILEGGSLIIEDSHIRFFSQPQQSLGKIPALILGNAHSTIQLSHTDIDCQHNGGLLEQHGGTLSIENCSISNTTLQSAILFDGDCITLQETTFLSCFAREDGGAIFLRRGEGQVKNCSFIDCEAQNGGAIFCNPSLKISHCNFTSCKALIYGSAIYYNGEIHSQVSNCMYHTCEPQGEELVQYLGNPNGIQISNSLQLQHTTILDCPLTITETGLLEISHSSLYISYTIQCSGILNMKHVKVFERNIESKDLFHFTTARNCNISYCEFDGHLNCGIFHATGARLHIHHCIFRNTANGRAIYNALTPNIQFCIFSFCEEGALYCKSGKIKNCTFINCRSKSGAGILMYGNRGEIEKSNFIRCISEYSGGAIDMSGSYHVVDCNYEECKPNNISK